MAPEAGFFSEEEEGSLSDPCWILDPIDGTTNLVYGFNMSSVSLGLYQNGEIVFGVVYNPFTDECFTAEKGKGAWLNGSKRLHVSNRELKDALVEFGAGSTHKDQADANFDLAKKSLRNASMSAGSALPHSISAISRTAASTAISKRFLSPGILRQAL
ncbi:inositol monophosphatase family protein [Allobaculum sp. Allo2]|uniref:inositol monophosphatase family protein n=1 Tax=Allobaculum sp. Allo2 TaxID=2853432 RepID=UPI001F607F24|nr:inositol monophosphatase family protein [Allobaculum sp. Allo2]UNT92896.1 hypothetical protein KWG61_12650 [Allobaculum sp. Allo2]